MRINKQISILIISWVLINSVLYYALGIKYAIDTTRFDIEADAWLHGQVEFSYRFWYSGYIALLAGSKLIFNSIYPSIIFQYLFSLTSILLFYNGLCKILNNKTAGFIATLLVITYIPIQQWNTCILTESIFISLILLFIWALSIESSSKKWLVLFTVAILASTIRPNGGILFITCAALYSIQDIQSEKYLNIKFYIIAAIGLILLHNFTDTFYKFLLDSFNKGEVICGYNGWTFPNGTAYIENDERGSITKIIDLIQSNPIKSLQLFASRFIALWMDIRAYYNITHNIYIGFFLLFTYSTAIIGFIQFHSEYTRLKWTTLIYCGLNSILIMVTYADWDGRFLAPLLPVIFIWSGLGIYFSSQFLKRKKTVV
jgi:hypothetical protein